MAEKVKIDVAVVGAQQAAAQTKTLKQQIKDLRTELEGLTAGTEEYNQKITELGNAMHQQQEITEQARMATQDYGATLGNLSSIASGVVGSITAVNGVMNVLGASNKGAEETIKTMTSLIGILQGLKAIEDAEKNFKELWNKIKLATTATETNTAETKKNTTSQQANSAAASANAKSTAASAAATKAQAVAAGTATKANNILSVSFKNLGRAIKAFMASNPFTLILLAVTSLISVISNLIDKTKEEKKALEEMKNEARLAASEAPSMAYGAGETETSKIARAKSYAGESYQYGPDPAELQKIVELERFLENSLKSINKYGQNMTAEYQKQKILTETQVTDLNDAEQIERELLRLRTQADGMLLNQYEEIMNTQQELVNTLEQELELAKENYGVTSDEYKAQKDRLDNERQILANRKKQFNDTVSALNEIEARVNTMDEEAKRKRQQAIDDAKAALEKAKSDALARIKAAYDIARKLEENAYANEETTTEEHYARLKEIEDTYYAEYADIMNGNIKTYKKYIAKYNQKQQELEAAEANHASAILSIEKDLATELQRIRAWETDPSRNIALARAEREEEAARAYYKQVKADNERVAIEEERTRQQRLEFEAAWFVEKLNMLDEYNREASKREHEAAIESLRIQQERKEQEIAAIGANYDQNRSDEETQYKHDLQMLEEQCEQRLITQQQYQEKREELTNEHLIRLRELETNYINDLAQAESDLSDTRLQIQQEEFSMEQELFEQKKEMIKSYINAFTAILGAVTSLLAEVQNQYEEGSKEYEKIAEAMLIMQTIEGSLAAFVSGVESGLVAPYNFILGGVLAALATATGVMAIQNLKSKKLSSSAASAPTINPYETLSYETNSNIEGNIQDSRCYVLESDITSTQNRVSVAEDEASF